MAATFSLRAVRTAKSAETGRGRGGIIRLDSRGYVSTGPAAPYSDTIGDHQPTRRRPMVLETSRSGIFAAGDVRSGSVKRVASAVGEGSMAIRQIHEYFGTIAGAG